MAIQRVTGPLIWVITLVTLLSIRLITTHEPSSTVSIHIQSTAKARLSASIHGRSAVLLIDQ